MRSIASVTELAPFHAHVQHSIHQNALGMMLATRPRSVHSRLAHPFVVDSRLLVVRHRMPDYAFVDRVLLSDFIELHRSL
jgi:hypothetical protein